MTDKKLSQLKNWPCCLVYQFAGKNHRKQIATSQINAEVTQSVMHLDCAVKFLPSHLKPTIKQASLTDLFFLSFFKRI